MDLLTGHLLYLLATTALALAVPAPFWEPSNKQFLLALGLLATWRYSWTVLNWARFLIYRHLVFPRWRREAESLGEDALPEHVYLLVTSFRIGTETTRRVYASVFAEAIACGLPCTIVASIVERADQFLIRTLFEQSHPPEKIKLIFVRIGGTGKRDALASGFRAISRACPPANSITAVVDGDSMLSPGLIRRSAPFFALMPNLGALTTDETCEVEGKALFRHWYNLRFAQRHVYMGSASLSRRVLTLTGRMSMFRTEAITHPDFIRRVELDWVDHWRLGRFKFLTGDDKSTWFHLLAAGREMIYLPDVSVMTIETPPEPSFLRSSATLMRRWFGNMLRTNMRAIALGPKPMGWYPWLMICDQRIAMWTSLAGPVLAILATFTVTPFALVYYLLWILITRYIVTLGLLVSRPRVSALWPLLLWYNQLLGAWIKTSVLFRLDAQKWTRQGTALTPARSRYGALAMQSLAYGCFLLALTGMTGLLPAPSFDFWWHLARGY